MIDWIERRQRTPSLGSGALLLDAYGGALQPPRARRHGVRAPRHALLAPVPAPTSPAAARPASRWINGVWRALRPYASGQAYQNYIDPQLAGWQRAYYGSNLERLREIKEQVDPDFLLPLPPGDPAGLTPAGGGSRVAPPPPAQPGYLPFVSAATLARVSDEMFSVGVVLLVLDRTGSAGLAGLAVAAITLPSLLTGPLLGAWLDLTGRGAG